MNAKSMIHEYRNKLVFLITGRDALAETIENNDYLKNDEELISGLNNLNAKIARLKNLVDLYEVRHLAEEQNGE